jgi:glutaredoxin-like YruB-family protein
MPIRIMLAVITLLLAFSLAGAEMYQWVDDNGSVTFKDSPPPASRKQKKVKVYSDSDFDPAPPQPVPATRSDRRAAKPAAQTMTSQNERFTGTVEIYVTEWCGYCKKAQKYMKDKGIPFVVYDIEKDSAAMQRHKEFGGRGVPLIVIGTKKMSGFSPESFERFLNNSR